MQYQFIKINGNSVIESIKAYQVFQSSIQHLNESL